MDAVVSAALKRFLCLRLQNSRKWPPCSMRRTSREHHGHGAAAGTAELVTVVAVIAGLPLAGRLFAIALGCHHPRLRQFLDGPRFALSVPFVPAAMVEPRVSMRSRPEWNHRDARAV